MKVLFSLAGVLFISGLISAHKQPLHYPVREDRCAPEPVCHQCITGAFPADLCCKDVQNYHKLQLANPNDCSSYFQCANNRAVRVSCPVGLHWSVHSERCEWPIDARCGIDGDTPVSPPWDGSEPGWPGDNGGGEPGWPGDGEPDPGLPGEDNGGTSWEVVGDGGESESNNDGDSGIGNGGTSWEVVGNGGESESNNDGDSGIGDGNIEENGNNGGNNINGNDGNGSPWNNNYKRSKLSKSTSSKTK